MEQEGQIDFYQFDFSLGNVLDIIAVSKPKSQQCIMLPKEVVSALKSGRVDGVGLADRLPSEQNLPSDEDLEKKFIAYFDAILKEKGVNLSQMQSQQLLQALDYGKNDDLFKDWQPKLGDEIVNKGVVRGHIKDRKDRAKHLFTYKFKSSEDAFKYFLKYDKVTLITKNENSTKKGPSDWSKQYPIPPQTFPFRCGFATKYTDEALIYLRRLYEKECK